MEEIKKVRKPMSEETKEKIRQAHLGKHQLESTKKKISKHNGMHRKEVRKKSSESLKKSGAERAEKRKATIKERYPDGLKQTKESNRKRSLALRGRKKSETTKRRMRKPKSEEGRENIKQARALSWAARKAGMTYKQFLHSIGDGLLEGDVE